MRRWSTVPSITIIYYTSSLHFFGTTENNDKWETHQCEGLADNSVGYGTDRCFRPGCHPMKWSRALSSRHCIRCEFCKTARPYMLYVTKSKTERYCPARWIRLKLGSFDRRGWFFRKILPSPFELEPFNSRAPSCTVIGLNALNGQMRSKAHSALTAPLVLHHMNEWANLLLIF